MSGFVIILVLPVGVETGVSIFRIAEVGRAPNASIGGIIKFSYATHMLLSKESNNNKITFSMPTVSYANR